MKTMIVLARALSRTPTISSAGDGEHDEHRRQVERAAVLAAGCAIASGSVMPNSVSSRSLKYCAPADGDRRDRDGVLEDQVPADDPRDELAERRVRVRVGAARDRDRRCQLGVGERGERARDAGEDEDEDDRRPGVADRLADDHEDAGADDRADAERGQVEQADGALEAALGVGRRAGRRAWWRRARCACVRGRPCPWATRRCQAPTPRARGGASAARAPAARRRGSCGRPGRASTRRRGSRRRPLLGEQQERGDDPARTRLRRRLDAVLADARGVFSALSRALSWYSLRGSGDSASRSTPSTLTTSTEAPVCSASWAAASATHGSSAPALAATTILSMDRYYPGCMRTYVPSARMTIVD